MQKRNIRNGKGKERLEAAEALLFGLPVIEIKGDSSAVIEEHRGIGAYSEEQIVILHRKGRIVISGSELSLRSMSREQIVVTGRIDHLSLERSGHE